MSDWGFRVCAACEQDMPRSAYSRAQWAKPRSASRCSTCVGGGNVAGVPSAARQNLASDARFESHAFAEGSFRLCYRGTYTDGERLGQQCVKKVFKSGSVFADDFFDVELSVVRATLDILTQWNGAGFVEMRVRLNKPEVWRSKSSGERHLVEPFVKNFTKFNSNSGYVCPGSDASWPALMQALSHYSYHVTSGNFLLCDLQGGLYADGAVLTDPVMMSKDGRFGPTDLGREGMINFFTMHECGEYCRASWTRPHERGVHFAATAHTTMRRSGPTAPRGAAFMTGGGGSRRSRSRSRERDCGGGGGGGGGRVRFGDY